MQKVTIFAYTVDNRYLITWGCSTEVKAVETAVCSEMQILPLYGEMRLNFYKTVWCQIPEHCFFIDCVVIYL